MSLSEVRKISGINMKDYNDKVKFLYTLAAISLAIPLVSRIVGFESITLDFISLIIFVFILFWWFYLQFATKNMVPRKNRRFAYLSGFLFWLIFLVASLIIGDLTGIFKISTFLGG